MKELSKFLEYGCIDSKLYWRTEDSKGQILYEVQWLRDQTIPWRFRRIGDLFWEKAKSEDITSALEKLDIDVFSLEVRVKNSILQQVAFADRMIQEARQTFGKHLVDQAILENQQFLSQLEDAVQRLTAHKTTTPRRPKLRVLKNSSLS